MGIPYQGWGFGLVGAGASSFSPASTPSGWGTLPSDGDDGTDNANIPGAPGSYSAFPSDQGFGLQPLDPVNQPGGGPSPFQETDGACQDTVNFEATPLDAPENAVLVKWELAPRSLDPALFTFEIQYANSPGFRNEEDYTVRSSGRVGILEFEDCDVNLEDHFREHYYRVVATKINEEEVQIVSPVIRAKTRPANHRDSVLAEIRHRFSTLMRYTGTPVAYYPVKTHGTRCHVCYSEILSRCSDSKCKYCFRTTFLGGYHLPLPRYVQFSPAPKRPDIRLEGKEHRTFAAAMLPHDPIAQPGDLIKDLETGDFWDVAAVEPPTTKRGAIGHQNLVLYKLDRDDIEWQAAGDVNFNTFCGFDPWGWHPAP